MRLLIGSPILSAAAVLVMATAAYAAPDCPPPAKGPAKQWATEPPGHRALFLTVSEGERPGHDRTATLACEPPHGSHPSAEEACRALAKVDGDPASFQDRPVQQNVACTLQYQPITVTANGAWGPKQIKFTKTYGNLCALQAETGLLFGLR